MSDNLYFKSDKFDSSKSLALFIHESLIKQGLSPSSPEDEDYMFTINAVFGEAIITFYMGENDEDSTPPLWQIWPQQNISFFKRIFAKVDKNPEVEAKKILEKVINEIDGVSDVEWGI